MILLRPWCWIVGHKRGAPVYDERATDGYSTFRCPRCSRFTRYKLKPSGRSIGTPTDGSGT